ncbi:MAG: DUF4383 domain-containing protein [Chloroflexota bacterium]
MAEWTRLRKMSAVYALGFIVVVVLTHLPGLNDEQGAMLGLFKIDPLDDAVHGFSGLWAAFAAWRSHVASRFYFRVFGSFYSTDAVVGFFTGRSVLELLANPSVTPGYSFLNLYVSIGANLPHFIIGPVAVLLGFWLADRAWGRG